MIALRSFFQENGIETKIYVGSFPTKAGDEYIRLMANGNIRDFNMYAVQVVLLSISVKNLSDGTQNIPKLTALFNRIAELLNPSVELEGYIFQIRKGGAVSETSSFHSGYTTKSINLQVFIY